MLAEGGFETEDKIALFIKEQIAARRLVTVFGVKLVLVVDGDVYLSLLQIRRLRFS
jgi:hypothetical protein